MGLWVSLRSQIDDEDEVYSDNITHNLIPMATEAGIYQHLWQPEEIGVKVAWELIEPLDNGLRKLLEDPDRFVKLNPHNGWGDYRGLVEFVVGYLAACWEYPSALVRVGR